MVSITLIPVAVAVVLLFFTAIVYVKVLLTITGLGDPLLVIETSVHTEAECGPGLASRVIPVVMTPLDPALAP
jgi:hypothetical protein